MFQSLEPRRLLAVTFSNVNGNITITGTPANDILTLRTNAGLYSGPHARVTVHESSLADEPVVFAFYADQVESLTFNMGDGNDAAIAQTDYLTFFNKVTGHKAKVRMYGGNGNDSLRWDYTAPDSDTLIDGGAGNDSMTGARTFIGGSGNDVIESPNITNAVVDAGSGGDRIYIFGAGTFDLGEGDDRAYFDHDSTSPAPYEGGTVYGRGGRDWIQARDTAVTSSAKPFVFYAGAGIDTVIGSKANDKLYGEADNDLIYGNFGNDTLDGGTGNDTLDGDAGNDKLYGGDGADSLIGDKGLDSLYGQLGIDKLVANDGEKDYLSGGAEVDTYLKDVIDVVVD